MKRIILVASLMLSLGTSIFAATQTAQMITYNNAKVALKKALNRTASKDELKLVAIFEELNIIKYAKFPMAIEDIKKINDSDYQVRVKLATFNSKKIVIEDAQLTILDKGSHIIFGGQVVNTKTLKKEQLSFLKQPYFNQLY